MSLSAPNIANKTFDPALIKREFPGLRATNLHYLDSAATAQMPRVVLDALRHFEIHARANVHEGLHSRSRAATDSYNKARAQVARFLHAKSEDEVVFTYGATSAINLLAYSYGARLSRGDEILLSVLEHHSNLVPWQQVAERNGVILRFLPVTLDGRLDFDKLDRELTNRCRLVALTHCSNVTGALTDVARIVKAAGAVGARVMLDGAQRAPHGPLDVQALDIDFYAFSGHKTYGPTGIGVLWGRRELLSSMPPFMTGGQMIKEVTPIHADFRSPPRRFEAGTPPIAAAIGLGAALDWMQSLDWRAVHLQELRLTQRLLDGLKAIQGVRILGPTNLESRRGVVSFVISRFPAEQICRHLDGYGVALRGGHHCAQPLIRAMGVDGATRASLAVYSIDRDVDALLSSLNELVDVRGRQ
jgi:cysteine desulfurase / selenocysteine lyase